MKMQMSNLFYPFLITLFLWSSNAIAEPVNVNQASSDEIAQALTGVGQAKAQRISDYCHQFTCQKAEDLLAVKGIGAKTLEKIEADLRF